MIESEIILIAPDEKFTEYLTYFNIDIKTLSIENLGEIYKGVIVVDFSDDLILQEYKSLYIDLFLKASSVAISYFDSPFSIKSTLLNQLSIKEHTCNEQEYSNALFIQKDREEVNEVEIEVEYDFTANILTSFQLKTFLTCRRKFYYKHVLKLQSHNPKKNDITHNSLEHMSDVKEILHEIYRHKRRFKYSDELEEILNEKFKKLSHTLSFNFSKFIANEIERFKSSEVKFCDVYLTSEVQGIELMCYISRVDNTPNGLDLLDYKMGAYHISNKRNVEQATDFTLQFYSLVGSALGPISGIAFYDIKDGTTVQEDSLIFDTKLNLLKKHLKYLATNKVFNFEKIEEGQECTFCPYNNICWGI